MRFQNRGIKQDVVSRLLERLHFALQALGIRAIPQESKVVLMSVDPGTNEMHQLTTMSEIASPALRSPEPVISL